jgi:acyl-[acyl carrier protein]--UDP-N-acetylglucosamine O-acyltransferase
MEFGIYGDNLHEIQRKTRTFTTPVKFIIATLTQPKENARYNFHVTRIVSIKAKTKIMAIVPISSSHRVCMSHTIHTQAFIGNLKNYLDWSDEASNG